MMLDADMYVPLLQIAREAIRTHLNMCPYFPTQQDKILAEPHGVFVTLTTATGKLRGCIGHIFPVEATVVQETAVCAVLAATKDPRFPAVTVEELQDLVLDVSVLTPPETVPDASSLDPGRYGVIVSSGSRRGVLLPALDGVDTVEQQLDIVRRKALIGPNESVELQRFETIKVSEIK